MKAIALTINGKSDEALRVYTDGERLFDPNTKLVAMKNYIGIQAGKKEEDLDIDYVSPPAHTEATMTRIELALGQKKWEDAAYLLNSIFEDPVNLNFRSFGSDNNGCYWAFFQCVVQQGQLALLTGQNQEAAINLLKKYLPESPVALELMGDLYGARSVQAMACYEKALLCVSYNQKDRVRQKINKIQNR